MIGIDVTLGLPDHVLGGLRDGRYYRDGGIIREYETGRIVALLRDGDVADSSLSSLLQETVVPLALQGATFAALARRLEAIEEELRQLHEEVRHVYAGVLETNAKLDGQMLGHLLGTIHACALDLAHGRVEQLPAYQHSLLQSYHALRLSTLAMLERPEVLREHPQVIVTHARAMQLAAVAARDLASRQGRDDEARALAERAAADAASIAARSQQQLERPSALFWQERLHRDAGRELDEASRRLAGHAEVLRLAPPALLRELTRRPVEE